MNEAQFNARAARDPMWFTRFARGFMALCLRNYEDVLRAQHAALLARSRANPNSHYWAYANPQFYDGRDCMGNEPLFWEGGPPRHYGAVGDFSERQRLFNALQGTQLSAYFRSSAYAKLRSLHHRMWGYFSDFEGRSPWQVISEIYRIYHMYASGANERAEMLGFGIAGAAIGGAGLASNLAGLGSRSVPMVQPRPVSGGRTTLPGLGPEVVGSGRTTLPGLGPEEIGPARPGGVGRTPGPVGIRDTIEDLQYSSTLPGPARETTPPPAAYEQLVEATATELGGASGRGGRLLEPLTAEGAEAIGRSAPASVAYYFPEGNFEARSSYAQAWRHFGGTGSPPEGGFVVRGASGETELIALTFRPQRMENARLAPMTEQQREGIHRAGQASSDMLHGEVGYEIYAAEWRAAGGEGPPPEFGFIIRQPDGTTLRSIGYYRRGMGL